MPVQEVNPPGPRAVNEELPNEEVAVNEELPNEEVVVNEDDQEITDPELEEPNGDENEGN